jgi:DNA-directed RNA polymerase subunit RPC12/RpoP
MKCKRCKKEFDTTTAELNAETYGGNMCACPNCGKAYYIYRSIKILAKEVSDVDVPQRMEDDWCTPIVTDAEYNKKNKK